MINTSLKSCYVDKVCLYFYLFFLFCHVSLIWLLPYFPTQDGPSHIYNLAILHDLINGGKEWGEYFSYTLKLTPNYGFNLLAYPLLSIVSPLVAEKIFLSLYIVLMGLSVHVLISTYAPSTTMPGVIMVLSVPVIFNYTVMMGFYSYMVAVPLFLVAISMVWLVRNRSYLLKFVCCNTIGFALFACHLIPFVFYLFALLIIAVVDCETLPLAIKKTFRQLVCIFPLILLFAMYMLGNSSHLMGPDFTYLLSSHRARELFKHLFTFSTLSFSSWQILPLPAYWLVLIVLFRKAWGAYIENNRRLSAEQRMLLLLVSVLAIIFLLAPNSFGGGSFFNFRFPWVLLLLFLPLLASFPISPGRFSAACVVIVAMLSFCTDFFVLKQQTASVLTFLQGLDSGCSKGELISHYRRDPVSNTTVDVIQHAASYYGLVNGCVDVGNYEVVRDYFPVHFVDSIKARHFDVSRQMESSQRGIMGVDDVTVILAWGEVDEKGYLSSSYDKTFSNEKLSVWRRR